MFLSSIFIFFLLFSSYLAIARWVRNFILHSSSLIFHIFNSKEVYDSLHESIKGQKFKHVFCHNATFGYSCVKSELTFAPYSLMGTYLKKYFFIFLLFCCACSPTFKHQETPLILDKNTLQIAEDKKTLEGTGRLLFKTPLFGLYSKEIYFIKAQLFNESSSLILYSHFTGFAQQDGIKMFFIRDKNSLIIKTSTTSYPVQTLHTDTSYFTKNQNLEVYIEVQNGTESFISIKIWDAYTNPSGSVKEPARFLSRQNLIVDSSNFLFYSKGQGMLWGIQLNKVSLNFASREPINQ